MNIETIRKENVTSLYGYEEVHQINRTERNLIFCISSKLTLRLPGSGKYEI